jgi:hypothetical protein
MAKNQKRKNRSMPGARGICLKDECGNFLRLLSREELEFMLERRAPIKQVTLTVYQEIPRVKPSNSQTSRICLTGGSRNGKMAGDGGDMHALAGMKFSEARLTGQQKERLIGHGVLVERATIEKPFRVETRVIVASQEELDRGYFEYHGTHSAIA